MPNTNHDLDVDDQGAVARDDEVKAKTTPNLRDETSTDNSQIFEMDFLVLLDGGGKVDDELAERQETAVRQAALQRGLLPDGPVKLSKAATLPDGRNTRLVYQLPVKLNTAENQTDEGIAVAIQPDDTTAEVPGEAKARSYSDWVKADLEAEIASRNSGRDEGDKIVPASTKNADLAAALKSDDGE